MRIILSGTQKHTRHCPRSFSLCCCCCLAAHSYPTLCDPMDCSTPGFPVLHYLLELAQTHVHLVSDAINHLVLCCPLFLPSIFPSIRVFSNESALCSTWWYFVCVCVCVKLLQLWPTLSDPMVCNPPGYSIHGILQARILEWIAMPSSRRSSRPRVRTRVSFVSCIGRQEVFFTTSAPWEAWYFT